MKNYDLTNGVEMLLMYNQSLTREDVEKMTLPEFNRLMDWTAEKSKQITVGEFMKLYESYKSKAGL